jgi:DNA-binding NtrC family response regulator
LIAEDNQTAGKQLQQLLETKLGVCVDIVADGSEALEALSDGPYSIVLTDLKMPHMSGMELIEEVQKRRLPVVVIVMTGHGSIDEAVQAMRLGATDFLTKPIDFEHLRLIIQRALRERALHDEVATLREQLHERFAFHHILSKSPKMLGVFELIGDVAQSDATVLIEGETGTGKELVARAVHHASAVRTGPFVAVNCAAVPETLLESELFGHEKGSFTGATGQRKGRFELAHGGTIFLDEVGDVPAAMQAKLLRVLQERGFERVGGSQTVEVDVRVITATNRSLQAMVQEAKFREDLYYRLNVVKIHLPPLRERREDIPLLVGHFLQKYARPGAAPKQMAPPAMEALLRYQWPGNVRQLENAVERGCVTARDEIIGPRNLPSEIVTPSGRSRAVVHPDLSQPLAAQIPNVLAAFEERYLRRALRKARGSLARTARIAGLSKRTVTSKLAQHKIDRAEFRVQT